MERINEFQSCLGYHRNDSAILKQAIVCTQDWASKIIPGELRSSHSNVQKTFGIWNFVLDPTVAQNAPRTPQIEGSAAVWMEEARPIRAQRIKERVGEGTGEERREGS
jgi:hypothetical protein